MTDHEAQALEFIKQAESKGKKGFFSGLMGGSDSGYEKSADLYEKAANHYKMAQKFAAAGNTFEKQAKVYQQANVLHEAVSSYLKAATAHLNVDVDNAVNCYMAALKIQEDQGKFTQAAKTHADIAEQLESRNGDSKKVAEHFEKAAIYYEQENQKSSAYKYQQRWAAALASAENLSKAAEVFEKCANYSASQNLLKYSTKDHVFQACLCLMALDLHQAKARHQTFLEQFPNYAGTRESALITSLLEAIDREQLPEFQKALTGYDSVSKLSPLCTQLLLKIKRNRFTEDDEIC